MKINRPYFLGIGANRSATTWLSKILKKHPQVYIPPIKEIHYFDMSPEYLSPTISAKDSDGWWQRAHRIFLQEKIEKKKRWLERYLFGAYNDAWYLSLFDDAGAHLRCGEITPAYSLLSIPDIKRVYRLNPDLRIIFIMRNPVHRAWSGFLHFIKIKKKKYEEFNDSEIIEHLQSESNTRRGDYLLTIHNWARVFPSEQFHYVFFDDIVSDPEGVIKSVQSFLNLTEPFKKEINFKRKANEGLGMKMPLKFRDFLHEMYDDKIEELYKELNNPIIKTWKRLT